MYVHYTTSMPATWQRSVEVSYPLELDLWMVMNHLVLGTETVFSGRATGALATEPTLAPSKFSLPSPISTSFEILFSRVY